MKKKKGSLELAKNAMNTNCKFFFFAWGLAVQRLKISGYQDEPLFSKTSRVESLQMHRLLGKKLFHARMQPGKFEQKKSLSIQISYIF
jgi:hypothetical protein